MQQCPKCASSVPDGRTTCQICSAELDPSASKVAGPIGLQAPPAARPLGGDDSEAVLPGVPGIDRRDQQTQQQGGGMPGASSGGVELRTTLAGDVVEVQVSAPPRAGGPLLGGASPTGPGGRPGQPGPVPIARAGGPGPGGGPPRRAGAAPIRGGSTESKGSGGKTCCLVAAIVFVVLLVAGGGIGYWVWQQAKPVATTVVFLESARQKKWDVVFDQIELPEQYKAVVTKDRFLQLMGVLGPRISIDSYEIVDKPVITGDTAAVKVKITQTVNKKQRTDTTTFNLKQVQGVWKIDASAGVRALPGLTK